MKTIDNKALERIRIKDLKISGKGGNLICTKEFSDF